MTIAEPKNANIALPLESLAIRGYRAFKELTIPTLARVNLVTGKNNVGKTSFLEAIYLRARRGSPEAVWQVLGVPNTAFAGVTTQSESAVFDLVLGMFSGASGFVDWAYDRERIWEATIGPTAIGFRGAPTLTLGIVRPRPETDIPVGISAALFGSPEGFSLTYALRRIVEPDRHVWVQDGVLPSVLVGPKGLSRTAIGQLWDNIALAPSKGDVVNMLRIIVPDVHDVALFGEQGSELGRVPNVRLSREFGRHPISEFGDGMNRLFDIIVALVNSASGIFLVDEIENGLHYSVLINVWKTIFELARRLDVQVFATTHSWECIEAFQVAASESEADGALIRLRNKNGDIRSVVFDEQDLTIVTRDQLEVR